MTQTDHVTIVEVGPRDGLQNEAMFVPTDTKIDLINRLSETGLRHIEATSFVSARAIPQLADNEEVFTSIKKIPGVHYSALVPNERGMLKALEVGVREVAVFTAASETFNQRNINSSIADSILRFEPVFALAREQRIPVRAYISCALGCPYEGAIRPEQVAGVARQLLDLGADDICLGDTIGVGTVRQTREVIRSMLDLMPVTRLSMHFHDTYGQAIANISASLELGIRRFDSSVAGLGGCPYARGATGNVATEDVLYLMHGLGMDTGVDIYKVVAAGDMICRVLNKRNQSKVASALLANPQ
ncbi:hydroxymethylglutaryl-CoA lyase [Legionella sp. CNM-4043-24]|uniref:hydroxymethylglutaryl-CoA lyase n=1 Tax=Legionella sp. CNM-4043-24 TaxID=3421646 RepID=UPI00403A9CB9